MRLNAALAISGSIASLFAYSLTHAQSRPESRAETHPEAHTAAKVTPHPAPAHPPRPTPPLPRPVPQRFEPHHPGVHPNGPSVHSHAVRVLSPTVVVYGNTQWNHFERPEFSRPLYYWDWTVVRNVTCIAEDSYGDQYPVTEATFSGFGLTNMTMVENDALDRCASESGGDPSCYLATCSHL